MVSAMSRQVAVVSYRLGGHDGVSVEARKWAHALDSLGFTVRRVAGTIEDAPRPDDVVIPGLAISATEAPDTSAVVAALDGADLVVVDNICSLPLNVDAARAVSKAATTAAARVLFRHHDLPWQRRHLAHLEQEFPPHAEGALHVTVNLRSRRELQARGYEHVTAIHNYFDLDASPGNRAATRREFGFADDELVVFQPARAIERKNVPGGLRFAQRIAKLRPQQAVRYWLSGPAEDDYEPTLDKLRARATTPITMGRAATAADAYAASDVIAFPSTWEGFGNPTIESIAARRPLAAFPYPVLAEILAAGVRLFSTEAPEALVRFLAESEETRDQYFDVNVRRARLSFDIAELPRALEEAFVAHGWTSW
jgi:glycosyltransferase involved in cell wall biosynthesis